MSIREFAANLGVSERTVSKWEAGGERIQPRPINQAALDTSLARASDDVRSHFATFLADAPAHASIEPSTPANPEQCRHPGDGKLMAVVDGEPYLSGPDDEPSSLPTFAIDVYPVTNAEYARFVEATGHEPPSHWRRELLPQKLANHPVVFVTWHDASAYAAWAGKALPSSAQWEKAARGPHGDVYPWGSQPTPAKCNVREGGIRNTTPVDRYLSGASPYDVYDLCGNVWEWCSTKTTPGRYELKGGAFTSPFSRATPATFNDADATMSDDDTGFRRASVD